MPKRSAGILMYRFRNDRLQVFLVHPGGPFWLKKDTGAWSIPKGEFNTTENPLAAAQREFQEETGFAVDGECHELTPQKQPGGKIVHAWAVKGDCDALAIRSNTFEMEWPPSSGKKQVFPEVDRAGWFEISQAKEKILQGQAAFIEQLQKILGHGGKTRS